jgi:hypothetical protein
MDYLPSYMDGMCGLPENYNNNIEGYWSQVTITDIMVMKESEKF